MGNPNMPPEMGQEEKFETLDKPIPAMIEQPEEPVDKQIEESGENMNKALDKTKILENYVDQMDTASKLFKTDEAMEKFVGTSLDEVMNLYNISGQELEDYMAGHDIDNTKWLSMSLPEKNRIVLGTIGEREKMAYEREEKKEIETTEQVHPLTGQVITDATPESIPVQITENQVKEGQSEFVANEQIHPLTGQVIEEAKPESIPTQQTQKSVEASQSQPTVIEGVDQQQTLAQINMKNQHGVEEWSQTPDGDYYVRKSDGTSEILPQDVFDDRYAQTIESSQDYDVIR